MKQCVKQVVKKQWKNEREQIWFRTTLFFQMGSTRGGRPGHFLDVFGALGRVGHRWGSTWCQGPHYGTILVAFWLQGEPKRGPGEAQEVPRGAKSCPRDPFGNQSSQEKAMEKGMNFISPTHHIPDRRHRPQGLYNIQSNFQHVTGTLSRISYFDKMSVGSNTKFAPRG